MYVLLSNALTTKRQLVINSGKGLRIQWRKPFLECKNSIEVQDKLRSLDCSLNSVSSYDFSMMYTTLPHRHQRQVFIFNSMAIPLIRMGLHML
jgi:hypothetical protein